MKRKNTRALTTPAQIKAAMPRKLWDPWLDEWADPAETDDTMAWVTANANWTAALIEWCEANDVDPDRFEYGPQGYGDLYRMVRT